MEDYEETRKVFEKAKGAFDKAKGAYDKAKGLRKQVENEDFERRNEDIAVILKSLSGLNLQNAQASIEHDIRSGYSKKLQKQLNNMRKKLLVISQDGWLKLRKLKNI
jgi:hypothetical protein